MSFRDRPSSQLRDIATNINCLPKLHFPEDFEVNFAVFESIALFGLILRHFGLNTLKYYEQ